MQCKWAATEEDCLQDYHSPSKTGLAGLTGLTGFMGLEDDILLLYKRIRCLYTTDSLYS